MGIRDDLLPVVDQLRALPGSSDFGLRRFAVTIRRRVWSGHQQGEGTATDHDIAILPLPRVRDVTARDMTLPEAEFKALNSNVIAGEIYKIDKITPRFTNADGSTGGYLAEQLRLYPKRDTGLVENLIVLVGDDGYLRECEQIYFAQDRAFGYSMLVKEIDRPRTSLQSIAITPANPTVAHGSTQQLIATGTFNGGSTSVLTALSAWSSSAPLIATVDIFGNVTARSAGTATITALVLGKTSTTIVTVT